MALKLVSFGEYCERVDICRDLAVFADAGVAIDPIIPLVPTGSGPLLVKYCESHPEFHVVSTIYNGEHVYERNCYVASAHYHTLATGDDDPFLGANTTLMELYRGIIAGYEQRNEGNDRQIAQMLRGRVKVA